MLVSSAISLSSTTPLFCSFLGSEVDIGLVLGVEQRFFNSAIVVVSGSLARASSIHSSVPIGFACAGWQQTDNRTKNRKVLIINNT